jgi:hypothetical protein
MITNLINYNNKTIPLPTPLVTLTQANASYNRDWGTDTIINLQGQLTGDYACIRSGQSGILSIFNQNFGNFEIYEATGATGFNFNLTANTPSHTPIPSYYTGISGAYIPKNSNLILRIDGSYGGFGITWERSKNKINWQSFTLYKTNYYSGNPFPYVPFSQFAYPQVSPYLNYPMTATPSQDNAGNQNNPNINGRGIYTGNIDDYNYFRLAITDGNGGGSPVANLIASGFDAEKIYQESGIIINSISFDESHYNGILNYNIELKSSNYSGNVIDPKNEFSFSENTDKTLNLTHSISARGKNTNSSSYKSNALTNAIDFVRSYTGLNNIPNIKFISGFNSNKLYLQNFSESIDRLNGSYSIEEQYRGDLFNTGSNGILNYSVNIASGAESNSIEISVRGSYKGPQYGDISLLRNSLNVTGLISAAYSGYFNPIPIQYDINENTGENSINFEYSFDNINLPNPYFIYNSTANRDELDQINNVQVKGEMIARGNLAYRSSLLSGNINNLTGQFMNVASGALSGFKDFNNIATTSNLRLLNISIDRNDKEGKLSATANYDDKFLPTGSFKEATYSVSVEAPRWYMNNQPTCNVYGFHIINDFDITTLPKLTLNTNTITSNDNSISESNLRKDVENISKNIQPNNYNFDIKLQDSYNTSKKYSNLLNPYEISYTVNKTTTSNQVGLLPKFNT